jgi:hypothetical protein
MAGAVQPWWCKAQTCVCNACRRAWRSAARCWIGRGTSWGGHGHRERLLGQGHGLRAPQGIHGIEDLPMREEHLV